MSIDLNKEAPNVVTEIQFKVLLRDGYRVQIIARKDPERRGNYWYGEWIVALVNDDRTIHSVLVSARSWDREQFRFREFKTANGLLSFMRKFGFAAVSIPMEQGGRTLHEALPHVPAQSEGKGG